MTPCGGRKGGTETLFFLACAVPVLLHCLLTSLLGVLRQWPAIKISVMMEEIAVSLICFRDNFGFPGGA